MKYRISILIVLTLVLITNLVQAKELRTLIPSAVELVNFRISEKPEYYTQDNLWDYINGSAPGYLTYGFQEMVTFLVQHQENQIEIVADIYDMGDSLNAFGIYSIERSPDGSSEEFGSGSLKSSNTLYFWQDRYYVKLMAYDVLPETAKSLSLLAEIISKKIPRKGESPQIFTFFPEAGQIERSERYVPRDVLGQEYLTDGYSIEYDRDDNKYQILLIEGRNAYEAKKNFQKYLSFVYEVGRKIDEDFRIGEHAFTGIDNFDRTIIFSRSGAHIIGVLGLNDRNNAREIIITMFSRL